MPSPGPGRKLEHSLGNADYAVLEAIVNTPVGANLRRMGLRLKKSKMRNPCTSLQPPTSADYEFDWRRKVQPA
jgi:hypothetical protein